MSGRSAWCLLVAALFASASSLVRAQRETQPRTVPELFIERRSPPVSGLHSIDSLRPPIAPPGVFRLPQFVRAAGMIFSGTVTRIERSPATLGESVETVAVTFHVENVIRGATPGQDLTIRQWIVLWSCGERYRLGERVLLFLYPMSKLGLTSWVGGPLGRFAVDPGGRVLLTAQQLAAFRKDPVLGGKSRARFSDFALAVRHATEEE